MTNKSLVLAHTTHHSIVLGSITFPRNNFHLKPGMFPLGTQERFYYCPGRLLGSVVFITSSPILPQKRTLVSAE